MGPVLDERLRVHGIDGLHVADCSVFPTVPRANTCLPAVLVAHRLAVAVGVTTPSSAKKRSHEARNRWGSSRCGVWLEDSNSSQVEPSMRGGPPRRCAAWPRRAGPR